MDFTKSKALQKKSHEIIPGGCHTYAKGDDQYPVEAPAFLARGQGSHVWDMDGNEFIEYGMGLRSVVLGHAYPPVIEAAAAQMKLGANFNRPTPIEVECGEKLLSLIDGAEMVKFAKNGSDVNDAAIRLSRAYTGRDRVAICGDHPFFSVSDWFIGTTAMNAGIPEAISNLTVKFRYNDLQSVQSLFDQYPGEVACLIMEPGKYAPPEDDFLQKVHRLCSENGALFILDEMITGFRYHIGGAQKLYGVIPDLSTFGKALGNGFAVSALVGKRDLMELGGLNTDKERVFLISTTHGAETHALAAALKVMETYETEPVIDHLHRQGQKLIDGIDEIVGRRGMEGYFGTLGNPCNLVFFTRDGDMNPSQPFRTLFMQEAIRRGLLMPSLVMSYSHADDDISKTLEGIDGALEVYGRALEEGVEKFLVGRPTNYAIRRFV